MLERDLPFNPFHSIVYTKYQSFFNFVYNVYKYVLHITYATYFSGNCCIICEFSIYKFTDQIKSRIPSNFKNNSTIKSMVPMQWVNYCLLLISSWMVLAEFSIGNSYQQGFQKWVLRIFLSKIYVILENFPLQNQFVTSSFLALYLTPS